MYTATEMPDEVQASLHDCEWLAELHGENDAAARRQLALALLGRRIQTAQSPAGLLEDTAHLAAVTLRVDHFGAARVRPDGQTLLLHFGSVDPEAGECRLASHQLATVARRSASAFALSTNEVLLVDDPAGDKRFEDAVLEHYEIACALVCPIVFGSRSLGTIGVYSKVRRPFSRQETLFVESLSMLLGANIMRERIETALAEQSKFLSAAMDSTDSLVVVLAPDGRINRFNRACQDATEFTPTEVKDRPFWSAFLLPEEVTLMKDALERVRRGESPVRVETRILTKLGQRKCVAWSLTSLRNDDGSVQSFVCSGIDVTEKHEVLDRLAHAEDEVRETQQSLAELQERMEAEGLTGDADKNGPATPKVFVERRNQKRRAYPYVQIVAPLVDGKLPDAGSFFEVRCHDISPGGFSFLVSQPTSDHDYVVAFGTPPALHYLTARVVHVTPYRHNDQDMFLVGCAYTGRARY